MGNPSGTCSGSHTGYRKDFIANTYFAQARKYFFVIGRFGGEDITGEYFQTPLSFNRYLYVYSNPLKYVDLNGETATQILEVGMGIAGGVAVYDWEGIQDM